MSESDKRLRRIQKMRQVVMREQQSERTMKAVRYVEEKLGLSVRFSWLPHDARGLWLPTKPRTIFLSIDRTTAYVVLHEAGHALAGLMCCREHCEYAAHGVAVGLAKAAQIRLTRRELNAINMYAGFSARRACGAHITNRPAEERKKIRGLWRPWAPARRRKKKKS